MLRTHDLLHETASASLRRKLEALERSANPLTLDQMATLLLKLAPDLYADPEWSRVPTYARPGSSQKIEVMAIRVACGYPPSHPNDLHLRQVSDRQAMLPTDAGNGLPGSSEVVVEWSDVDWTEDDDPDDDPREPLSERVRRWLDEQREIRERWKVRRSQNGTVALRKVRGAA